jgi:hypothetical protein
VLLVTIAKNSVPLPLVQKLVIVINVNTAWLLVIKQVTAVKAVVPDGVAAAQLLLVLMLAMTVKNIMLLLLVVMLLHVVKDLVLWL